MSGHVFRDCSDSAVFFSFSFYLYSTIILKWGRRGRDRIVIGFTTANAVSNVPKMNYLNFWNFSDPTVEVNAVVRHFRHP